MLKTSDFKPFNLPKTTRDAIQNKHGDIQFICIADTKNYKVIAIQFVSGNWAYYRDDKEIKHATDLIKTEYQSFEDLVAHLDTILE